MKTNKLSTFIKNYSRIHNTNIKYLLIPELHRGGINYYIHGLIMGLPTEQLHEFTQEEKRPIKILIEIAHALLPTLRAFYASPEGQAAFEEWKLTQRLKEGN